MNSGDLVMQIARTLTDMVQCKPDISPSCITRNWIYRGRMLDPIFLRPRTRYISRNRGNSLDPIGGRQFFAKNLLTAIAFVLGPRETIFRETNSSLPVNAGWNTCCAVVSHARRSIDTSIVSQSRVQLIQCQCKSRLQIANLGINNAFLIKSTRFTSAILSRHRDSSAANQERVIGRYSKIPLAVYAHQNKAVLMKQNGLIRPQIREITATSVSIDSIDTNLIQKLFDCHLHFRKCTLTVEYIAVLRVATLIFGENKVAGKTTISAIHGLKLIIYAQTTLIWNSTAQFCNARSNFDKCHYISCIRAEFAAKHIKAPLSFITRWRMESDFGSWQSPDISRSHLYRGTFPWTPPTAIYRADTVLGCASLQIPGPWFNIKMSYQYRKSHCGIRQSYDRLISTMGFPILVRHLYIESGPEYSSSASEGLPRSLPVKAEISTRSSEINFHSHPVCNMKTNQTRTEKIYNKMLQFMRESPFQVKRFCQQLCYFVS